MDGLGTLGFMLHRESSNTSMAALYPSLRSFRGRSESQTVEINLCMLVSVMTNAPTYDSTS